MREPTQPEPAWRSPALYSSGTTSTGERPQGSTSSASGRGDPLGCLAAVDRQCFLQQFSRGCGTGRRVPAAPALAVPAAPPSRRLSPAQSLAHPPGGPLRRRVSAVSRLPRLGLLGVAIVARPWQRGYPDQGQAVGCRPRALRRNRATLPHPPIRRWRERGRLVCEWRPK